MTRLFASPASLRASCQALTSSRVGFDGDQVLGERGERVDRLVSRHRNAQWHGDFGHVPDAGRVHLEVLALPVHQVALQQLPNDPDRLGQHVLAPLDRRPAATHDVLVEILAAAEPECESPVGEDLQRRGLLGHDRRVVAHRRARHVGHQFDAIGRVRDGAQRRPRMRRVPLGGQPRREVVAAHLEVEVDVLRSHGVVDEFLRAALLCHQGVSETHHGREVPGAPETETTTPGTPIAMTATSS